MIIQPLIPSLSWWGAGAARRCRRYYLARSDCQPVPRRTCGASADPVTEISLVKLDDRDVTNASLQGVSAGLRQKCASVPLRPTPVTPSQWAGMQRRATLKKIQDRPCRSSRHISSKMEERKHRLIRWQWVHPKLKALLLVNLNLPTKLAFSAHGLVLYCAARVPPPPSRHLCSCRVFLRSWAKREPCRPGGFSVVTAVTGPTPPAETHQQCRSFLHACDVC